MVVESFLSNAIYRSTCSSIIGLVCIGTGVSIYAASDYELSWLGTLFALLSTILMVWEALLKRHLLTDIKQPLALSLQAMVLLNHFVGFCLALLLALSYEVWLYAAAAVPHLGLDEAFYLAASVLLSVLYHYMGLQLAKAVSATSLLASNNLSKVFIVVFGMGALGDAATPLAIGGVVLALLGNALYMLSRLHVMQAQSLLRESYTEGHGGVKELSEQLAPGSSSTTSSSGASGGNDEEHGARRRGGGEGAEAWLPAAWWWWSEQQQQQQGGARGAARRDE